MENENQILDFLQGNLSEEQRREFKQRLEVDQDFYLEYQMLKRLTTKNLEDNYDEDYTVKVQELGAKYFDSKGNQNGISIKNILILIAILISVFLTIWFMWQPKDENLYDSHANHFALHLVLKSDDNSIALDAENAFNRGNFVPAIDALKKYLESNTIDTKARLALGVCYLEIGNFSEALIIFDEISSGSSTLKDYAIWYKALYRIKKSEYAQAKKLLHSIPELDPLLYNKSQALISDIELIESK